MNGIARQIWLYSLLVAIAQFHSLAARAAEITAVPNSEFRHGAHSPDGWQLTGSGGWVDREILEVSGTGQDSTYWRCEAIPFAPKALYRFQMLARRVGGSGSAITGPTFANRDQMGLTDAWQEIGHVFRVPEAPSGYLRLGQWHATGKIQFGSVRVTPVIPVHRRFGDLVLGEGEMIRDGQYQFLASFSHEGSNYHRPLHHVGAGFNSDRWTFGEGQQVIYRFQLPGRQFTTGAVEINVNYHTLGTCAAEVSCDELAWYPVATASDVTAAKGRVPEELLPADTIYLRLRATGPSNLQVNSVEFRGDTDGPASTEVGRTLYADLTESDDSAVIRSLTVRTDEEIGLDILNVVVGGVPPIAANAVLEFGAGQEMTLKASQKEAASFEITIPASAADGDCVLLRLGDATEARLCLHVSDFYRADYGERLAGDSQGIGLWWCDATRKIPRQRALPDSVGPAACLEAARGDWEAVQVVVRPSEGLHGLSARATALAGPGGAEISADNVRILQVHYHFVDHPTDYTGVRDWWPDALPPLESPIDVTAGQNQPLWVLVHVPENAAAGDYQGSLALQADGFIANVPIRLHVWDFTLPSRNHLETAYGLSVGNIFRYHGLKTDADKRRVLDLYLQSFAEHRISIYDPTPLDPIGVQFHTDKIPPTVEVDFSAFDQAMEQAVERFRITGFRLPIQGMGGGTFHERFEPKIGPFGEDTAEYQSLFFSYIGQLEQHLAERGWLDMAYVYWFDEPAPRDYEFVAEGMKRLDKYAPGLRRMLTEEPADNQLAGNVDLWCPVSHNYDHAEAEKRRQHGERFWWYVCTGPKAPYCTLFTDHAATELRIWHWQTWQRNIVGTLVWQSNYWTSNTAFPEVAQNPYEDPMGYVSGYSTPRGTKRYWGNGDGRFIYPPLAAATPGHSGSEPVLEGPVSSIRWEMIREGVEDYEYLHLLRQLIEQQRDRLAAEQVAEYENLLGVPESITTDMTTFTTNSKPIYDRRRQVAETIEQLMER